MVKEEGVEGFHPVRWSSLHTTCSLFLNVWSGLLGWVPQTFKHIRVGKSILWSWLIIATIGTKSCEGGVIELIAGRPKLMILGRKSSAPKESPWPVSSSSVSGPELLTQWKEKGFKLQAVPLTVIPDHSRRTYDPNCFKVTCPDKTAKILVWQFSSDGLWFHGVFTWVQKND